MHFAFRPWKILCISSIFVSCARECGSFTQIMGLSFRDRIYVPFQNEDLYLILIEGDFETLKWATKLCQLDSCHYHYHYLDITSLVSLQLYILLLLHQHRQLLHHWLLQVCKITIAHSAHSKKGTNSIINYLDRALDHQKPKLLLLELYCYGHFYNE